MPRRRSPEVLRFRRVAAKRLDEARWLLEGRHFTAATYLAGYAVECSLKAVLLASVPRGEVRGVTQRFRGNLGHDFEWLVSQIHDRRSIDIPSRILTCLSLVNHWNTSLRYETAEQSGPDARQFVRSATSVFEWAESRC